MNELTGSHPLVDGRTTTSSLVRAIQGVRGAHTPVWFMRQAGRSLPEYRALRTGRDMIECCLDPATAAEITCQPVRRHGVDAAVFFSDIIVPLKLAGVPVELVAGRGPVFAEPARTAADIATLRRECTVERLRENLAPITEAVRLATDELGSTPLIGFAGAPFTLAAYLVEGGPSKDHMRARTLMHADPAAWAELTAWAAELSGVFLEAQVQAGASAVQLFDSWAGSLSVDDYRTHVAPASRHTLERVNALHYRDAEAEGYTAQPMQVPTIHFAVGSGHLLEALGETAGHAIGVDWRTPLNEANTRLGGRFPLQGNIDPALLQAPQTQLDAHVDDVLAQGEAAPAHIVNLGHGVPPETDPDRLTGIVERVHSARL
ncbi:uroporphyrinogen decarboxylase [Leucobacter exalbidus]|uniref:Uroporphyrinogen decarboxylase n=1 Tax=Leucobacter exalbidus TaxID=662960 RepID=A0A940PX87_9MICO|nr:uroporphyrinogen decarboxylase [Leucobacter exalbidus]MBP1327024.1 uroporphyrinogen decarboxylase [Leucobacter exalbidus]